MRLNAKRVESLVKVYYDCLCRGGHSKCPKGWLSRGWTDGGGHFQGWPLLSKGWLKFLKGWPDFLRGWLDLSEGCPNQLNGVAGLY